MQPRRLIVYIAQALLLAASAVSGGAAVRQQANAATPDPVTTLHVAAGSVPAGQSDQVECLPVRAHDGESHRYWLRDDRPADDRTSSVSGS